MQQDYETAAQAPYAQNQPDAVLPAAAPSGADSGAPPAAPLTKEQRDQLARNGREIAAARRAAEAAEQRAQRAEQAAAQATSVQRQRDWDAYLNSLPPDQRAVAAAEAKADAALEQIGRLMQQPQQQPPPRQMTEDERAVAAQRILDSIAQDTGVRLSGREDGIDWNSRERFEASARALASVHRAEPLTQQAASEPAGPPVEYGRSLSPRPAAGNGRVTEDDLAATMWTKNWFTKKQRLGEQRDIAYRQAGVEKS